MTVTEKIDTIVWDYYDYENPAYTIRKYNSIISWARDECGFSEKILPAER